MNISRSVYHLTRTEERDRVFRNIPLASSTVRALLMRFREGAWRGMKRHFLPEFQLLLCTVCKQTLNKIIIVTKPVTGEHITKSFLCDASALISSYFSGTFITNVILPTQSFKTFISVPCDFSINLAFREHKILIRTSLS